MPALHSLSHYYWNPPTVASCLLSCLVFIDFLLSLESLSPLVCRLPLHPHDVSIHNSGFLYTSYLGYSHFFYYLFFYLNTTILKTINQFYFLLQKCSRSGLVQNSKSQPISKKFQISKTKLHLQFLTLWYYCLNLWKFCCSVPRITPKPCPTDNTYCKGTTNLRPTAEDNPTVHYPSETYKHPLWRSLKAVDPRLLSVSYLFIHYPTISLFITALFVTYLRHIPYSYIYPCPCSDPHSFLFRSLLGQFYTIFYISLTCNNIIFGSLLAWLSQAQLPLHISTVTQDKNRAEIRSGIGDLGDKDQRVRVIK